MPMGRPSAFSPIGTTIAGKPARLTGTVQTSVSYTHLNLVHKVNALMSNTNRLNQEKSPYLLQHVSNPVDWWPWCEEDVYKRQALYSGPCLVWRRLLDLFYWICYWIANIKV